MQGLMALEWDLPEPFVLEIEVEAAAIDEYGHANNADYLRWIEQVSWAHSEAPDQALAPPNVPNSPARSSAGNQRCWRGHTRRWLQLPPQSQAQRARAGPTPVPSDPAFTYPHSVTPSSRANSVQS